ncbi:DUF4397 domain-containing protein [Priestia megaterium]|nr:DUF4397 domain-containing protein [Priestia megaterium]
MSNYSFNQYIKKAMKYDLLSNYYKYSDPARHIAYYEKHLYYIQRAIMDGSQAPHTRARQPMARIFHASPDSPSVDVYLNEKRIIRNLTYKQETDYLPLGEPGRYTISIYPAGETEKPLLTKSFTFEGNQNYTIAAVDTLNELDLLFIYDNTDVPQGETKIRFIHLSPDAPAVDVAARGGDVIFSDVTFKEITKYLGLSPMMVQLDVFLAGTDDLVLSIPPLNLRPNRTYTVYAVGFANNTPALEALISQDR